MKIIIILITLSLLSCKENDYNYDESVIDSTVVEVEEAYVDSSAVAAEETYTDSSAVEVIEELPVREMTYEEVIETTSIYDLKDFIKKNPNHNNIKKLKERLIDLEVDEILNDRNTGKMPTSDKISESYSSISEVSIKNDTSCELEVRYSGNDSKMISIPAHQSASITLKSGYYRVAASACGSNYAGNENLSGNYSSSYYIVTSYR